MIRKTKIMHAKNTSVSIAIITTMHSKKTNQLNAANLVSNKTSETK